jgi:hypothetical protein
VLELLSQHGIGRQRLVLEITESQLPGVSADEALTRLRAARVIGLLQPGPAGPAPGRHRQARPGPGRQPGAGGWRRCAHGSGRARPVSRSDHGRRGDRDRG